MKNHECAANIALAGKFSWTGITRLTEKCCILHFAHYKCYIWLDIVFMKVAFSSFPLC